MITSYDGFAFPPKPKSTKVIGKSIPVTTNFFKFFIETKNTLYIYAVDVSPELPADSLSVYRTITRTVHESLIKQFKIYKIIGRNLISPTKVLDTKMLSKFGDVVYTVTLSLVRFLQVDDWYRLKDLKEVQLVKGFFNSLIKGYLSELKMIEIGRTQKYFDPASIRKLQDSEIEVWTGYKTCVNIYENKLLYLQIDYASRCLNTTTVLDFLNHLKMSGKSIQYMKEELKDKTVLAKYGNNRLYKITDIDFTNDPSTQTIIFRENSVTIKQYMELAYNLKIINDKQPLIISTITPKKREGKKGPIGQILAPQTIYLVPELLFMTGIGENTSNNHSLMRDLAIYTKLEPAKRVEKYTELLNKFDKLTLNPKSTSSLWGVKIDPTPVEFNAIVMQPPILFSGKNTINMGNKGTGNLKQPIVEPAQFTNWVFIHTSKDEENAVKLVDTMQKASKVYKIKVNSPTYVVSGGIKARDFIEAAKEAPDADIYLFYLPKCSVNEYGKIKAEMIQSGNLSQMVVSQYMKTAMSTCSKIVLQMNAKLNGILWKMDMSDIPLSNNTMMVGIDMSTDKGKTVIAFTSSYDTAFMRYYSQIATISTGQTIADCIKEFMLSAINYFYKANYTKFPEMILVYRQGLGENQFENVRKVEIEACIDAFKEINPETKTKLIFTIMNKKINDRVFTSSCLSNPPCGTLIDSVIVNDQTYEFFIQPQFVNQGTGTPTKFTVLFDNTDLNDRDYKLATYYLCYGYQNWLGGVRVPAPTMYAAKLAKLIVKSARNAKVNEKLPSLLHYL